MSSVFYTTLSKLIFICWQSFRFSDSAFINASFAGVNWFGRPQYENHFVVDRLFSLSYITLVASLICVACSYCSMLELYFTVLVLKPIMGSISLFSLNDCMERQSELSCIPSAAAWIISAPSRLDFIATSGNVLNSLLYCDSLRIVRQSCSCGDSSGDFTLLWFCF